MPRVRWIPEREKRNTLLTAALWFLCGIAITVIAIVLTSAYRPVIRLSAQVNQVKVCMLSTANPLPSALSEPTLDSMHLK